jgi:hypothetical protein
VQSVEFRQESCATFGKPGISFFWSTLKSSLPRFEAKIPCRQTNSKSSCSGCWQVGLCCLDVTVPTSAASANSVAGRGGPGGCGAGGHDAPCIWVWGLPCCSP